MAIQFYTQMVCITYTNQKAEDGNVVWRLHIDMKEGEAIAVVGPSGSGKST